MKYKQFMGKLICLDMALDVVNKDDVEVSCNRIEGVPVLFFKKDNKVIEVIVLR